MPDPRFYESLGPVSLSELATLTGAELIDAALAERRIRGVAPLVAADAGDIAYLSDRRYRADLATTAAGAVFVTREAAESAPEGVARLIVASPQVAYAQAAQRLVRARRHEGPDAIHPEAEVEEGVVLSPGVVVGAGARIGAGAWIGPNVAIGPGVAIGRRCRIHANTVIGFALIGDEVQILAGAAIGEPGFGVAAGAGALVDAPQLGRVILQDRVSVGANSCIDRGAFDDTVVGENTKIDNLVQIAHNVRVGRNCVIAAHVGLSGSVVMGDGVMVGGQAGFADHLKIGDGARIAAGSGNMKDVPAGEVWCGTPARPIRRFMRETAWLMKNAAGREDTTDE